jgi:Papain-like cysteine protease AvrRpt2
MSPGNSLTGPDPQLGGGGPPVTGDVTGFVVPHQEQTNWCWAAVTSGVSKYYSPPGLSQGTIASAELHADCEHNGASPECDKQWSLQFSLQNSGYLQRFVNTTIPFSDIQAEIGASSRPVCCQVLFALGSRHFMAIEGFILAADGTQYLKILDPYYPPSTITYDLFRTGYRSPGDTWTLTYLTQNGHVV